MSLRAISADGDVLGERHRLKMIRTNTGAVRAGLHSVAGSGHDCVTDVVERHARLELSHEQLIRVAMGLDLTVTAPRATQVKVPVPVAAASGPDPAVIRLLDE
jgi:hypothetical protein